MVIFMGKGPTEAKYDPNRWKGYQHSVQYVIKKNTSN